MRITLALIATYSICLIVAGHGAVPLGLLLFVGGFDSWFLAGKIMGWIGIAGLLLAGLINWRRPTPQWALQLGSVLLLYVSWFDIARRTDNESGSFSSTLLFSIPFQIAAVAAVVWLGLRIWRSRSGTGASS